MDDRDLRRRMLDAVLGDPDPELDAELSKSPDLSEEYQRLRASWHDLSSLPVHDAPPRARDEARTALLAEMSMREPTSRSRLSGPLRIAAALVLALGGFAAGRMTGPAAEPLPTAGTPNLTEVTEMNRYVLLVRESADQDARAMSEWARGLWTEDRLIWAELLYPAASIRLGVDAELPAQRLFLILARDRTEAIELANRAPHLPLGGSVEVLSTTPDADR